MNREKKIFDKIFSICKKFHDKTSFIRFWWNHTQDGNFSEKKDSDEMTRYVPPIDKSAI